MLVIDDDPSIAMIVEEALRGTDISIQGATTGAKGLYQLSQYRPDILFLDHLLPDSDGLRILAEVRKFDCRLPVIFVTARNSSELAIEAMKRGAFDFLTKPLKLNKIAEKTNQALESRQLMLMPVQLPSQNGEGDPTVDSLVGDCPRMQDVYKAIGRAAAHDVPVLLEGEVGTGKKLVARAIYQHGRRRERPFLKVCCSDFSGHWLESELFGHESHAFPGAGGKRIGKIEQCQGGTILLEEISAIPLPLQSKLVRLIHEKRFERTGGIEPIPSDVTLLFTSSQNTETLASDGAIRQDLYYLLSSFTIKLPPLREREADLPKLVDHFVSQFCHIERIAQSGVVRTSPEALRLLSEYIWPGNVAELCSVLRRALIESHGTVIAGDFLRAALRDASRERVQSKSEEQVRREYWEEFLRQRYAAGSNDIYTESVIEMERHVLSLLLQKTGGNQAKAARMLGITRTSLRKKINYLGLVIDEFLAPV